MPVYTIVGGVNGVGKSSLTGALRAVCGNLGVVVDPDRLIAQCGGDAYAGGQLAVQRLESALPGIPSGWTPPRKVCAASGTVLRAAGTTSRPTLCGRGLRIALRMWQKFCPIATRRISSTMTMALCLPRSIAAAGSRR